MRLTWSDPDLFDQAPFGYLIADDQGVIQRANRTFSDWSGYTEAELEGRSFSSMLSTAGRIYHETHFSPLLRMQKSVREIALDLIGASGARIPALVNASLVDSGGSHPASQLIAIFKSEDRRSYEQELLASRRETAQVADELRTLNAELEARVTSAVEQRMKAEEALRQAQKMEAIGQLTGGVAHDFNNLLTVIIGSQDSIARQLAELPRSPELDRIARLNSMARSGADRAATLTARLLAFARRQPLDPKPIDCSRMLAGISELLHRTLNESISLEISTTAGLWTALADSHELERALVNLAVNARDAMPSGGKLTIETANVTLDDQYVEALVEPVPPGQYVMVAVTDTGTGMTPETIERVFEPFFTTKEAGKGTGLGLSQVYGFVRQTGGHVRIYSELEVGTTVKLYLPRAHVAAEAERIGVRQEVHGGNEVVLVVEDHADLRDYSVSVLRELGYQVVEAGDGPAALEILKSDVKLDLLFTDVVLPGGMNGRQLADEAQALRPGLKMLFTTGYTRNAIVHNGKLDPGVALISKPFTYNQLAAKIRAVLD